MVFNFTKNYQFSSRMSVENETLETISETKLLGVMINETLSWDSNTDFIVKRANSRMRLLHKLVQFNVPEKDLITIYILFIRSILEQSATVWHSSLTDEHSNDLERVQKSALKVILQEKYKDYQKGLARLNLETLKERREYLCLEFATKCAKSKKMCHMFPKKQSHTK